MLLSYGDHATGGDGTQYQSHGSLHIPLVL